MSDIAVYVGEEAMAAGYRLAGLSTVVPDTGGETDAFLDAIARARLVLVSSALATRIEGAVWREACSAMTPLVAVVPDLDDTVPLPDVSTALRAEIGVAA